MKKHRFWHWWFTTELSFPYRFVPTKYFWQSGVQYKKQYCMICNRVVKLNYEGEL